MEKIKQGFKEILKSIVRGAIFIYFKVVYRAKVVGLENVPKDEPLIFCANHRSTLEPPLMVATAKRDLKFLAKEELYNNKFLAFLGWLFDGIPVKRDEKDINAIKTSLKWLKKGECIALFPEGTRNGLAKGQKVKDGAAFFAVRSGVKVLPCGIKGGEKGNRKMTITYGKPIDYSEYKGTKDKEKLEEITNDIMEHILSLTK